MAFYVGKTIFVPLARGEVVNAARITYAEIISKDDCDGKVISLWYDSGGHEVNITCPVSEALPETMRDLFPFFVTQAEEIPSPEPDDFKLEIIDNLPELLAEHEVDVLAPNDGYKLPPPKAKKHFSFGLWH